MSRGTFSTTGLVLKRSNVGESDRIVHLLTKDYGKLVCVAKGVRKVTSTKRAFLEPGNLIKGFFVTTKSMPLMTQATLDQDCSKMPATLDKFRQLTQILEIFERLFVEVELDDELYKRVLIIRAHVMAADAHPGKIRAHLNYLISELGFQDPKLSTYTSISDYVAALSDRPLNSFDYLSVK